MRRALTLLGATGSIGASTLDVVARHPDRYVVAALAAHRNHARLLDLCRRFRPRLAAMQDVDAAHALERALAAECVPTRVVAGTDGLCEAATLADVDTVLAAIVGAAGLPATLAAAHAGKRILLANKEALVIGGALFMAAVEAGGATLLPIDSEHNAVTQCLPVPYARRPSAAGVRRIVLTASGGPFRARPGADFDRVTPAEACAHPTWAMGRKISVDSATLMNKGLEVIEAHWLFGVDAAAITRRASSTRSSNTSTARYLRSSVIPTCGRRSRRRSPRPSASTAASRRSISRALRRSRSKHPIAGAFRASTSRTMRSRPARRRPSRSTRRTRSPLLRSWAAARDSATYRASAAPCCRATAHARSRRSTMHWPPTPRRALSRYQRSGLGDQGSVPRPTAAKWPYERR